METKDIRMTDIRFVLTREEAVKVIKYAGLLDRVREGKIPDSKNIDSRITEMLEHEDLRTMGEIYLEKSKSNSIKNCACHASVVGEDGCQRTDSDRCPGCDAWEEKQPRRDPVRDDIDVSYIEGDQNGKA